MASALRIDIWSDYVCPFCYLELPAVSRLQQEYGRRLQIVWRAFELRPEPQPTLDPDGDYLRGTWTRSVYPMAQERGMTLKLPPVQPRSRKALEAAAWARDISPEAFDTMHAAIFRAFFEQGRDIGQTAVLLEIAHKAGLPQDALRQALEQGSHAAQVREDQQLARELGIGGVPIMLLRAADASWQQSVPLQGAVPYASMQSAVSRLFAAPSAP